MVPGTYTVVMESAGTTFEQPLEVREDARLNVGIGERRAWTRTLLRLGTLWEEADELLRDVVALDDVLGSSAAAATVTESAELRRISTELRRRIQSTYGGVSGWVGGPTDDQQSQVRFFAEVVEEIRDRFAALRRRQGAR